MIVYLENPQESIKKRAMKLGDGFNNILGYTFNIQKPITSPSYFCDRQNNTLHKLPHPNAWNL